MRGINKEFIDDLKSGSLTYFLDLARYNTDICMEIRDGYISLYYKGGSALKITQTGKMHRGYSFLFNSKYCLNKGCDEKVDFFKSLNTRDASAFIK